jgi:outer membrane protein OmpA-like peptidoglycan-associated protein
VRPVVLTLLVAGALLGAAVPAVAAPPSSSGGKVEILQPRVRVLDPSVRRLDPKVRSLRTETVGAAGTTVTISSDVLFDFDSADLTAKARTVVDDTAQRLKSTTGRLTVVGHTDGVGTPPYNQRLSENRARSVADQLRTALGADRAVTTSGRAATEPVAPETVDGHDDPAGRALNRRVVITVGA